MPESRHNIRCSVQLNTLHAMFICTHICRYSMFIWDSLIMHLFFPNRLKNDVEEKWQLYVHLPISKALITESCCPSLTLTCNNRVSCFTINRFLPHLFRAKEPTRLLKSRSDSVSTADTQLSHFGCYLVFNSSQIGQKKTMYLTTCGSLVQNTLCAVGAVLWGLMEHFHFFSLLCVL